MKIDTVHCLFEQSGTFRNAFIDAGIPAFDYDIENSYNQTDFIVDIFKEIENFANDKESIFDNMQENDLIFAFFPCDYFSQQQQLNSRGQGYFMKNWTIERKIKMSAELLEKRYEYFGRLLELISICFVKNFRMIVENPYTNNYILYYLPKLYELVKINDRTKLGDNFMKPTMFLFFNCDPKFSIFNTIKKTHKRVDCCNKRERSEITSEFAKNFIKHFVL